MLKGQTLKKIRTLLGDRFLSSVGAGGNCAHPMRLPHPSPVLDKSRASMGPEILSSTRAGVWKKGSYGISRLQFCTGSISVCDLLSPE